MNQGDTLVFALAMTMALILASRSLRNSRFSLKTKAGMALAWVVLIVIGTMIAARWHP
jgi:hypothetical protein